MQGALPDGTLFQVSLPIDVWARIDVEIAPGRCTEVEGLPTELWKTDAALRLALLHFAGAPAHVRVRRVNRLPVGKGFGSSSADVVAAIRAVAAAFAQEASASDITALAARIEPTDGVASGRPAVVARDGRVLREWPWTPGFTVVAVAGDGTVDTCGADVSSFGADGDRYAQLLDVLDRAASGHDGATFAAVATESARLHLARRPQEGVAAQVLEACRITPALGVVIAHTGTCAGLLLPPAAARRDVDRSIEVLAAATRRDPTVFPSL